MASEDEVTVSQTGPGAYRVATAEGTDHEVTVPPDLVEEIGVEDLDETRLVRESFLFLLEREPATSILREFSLDVIGRYFPEYVEEIRRRLS